MIQVINNFVNFRARTFPGIPVKQSGEKWPSNSARSCGEGYKILQEFTNSEQKRGEDAIDDREGHGFQPCQSAQAKRNRLQPL